MDVSVEQMKLYKVNIDYVKSLYDVDHEVFYDPDNHNYSRKPYVGIVVVQNGRNYLIPLTSAKRKHSSWRNATNHNMLVYKNISSQTELSPDAFYKNNNGQIVQILSVLEIKKMIPVKDGLYHLIDIDSEADVAYRELLRDEAAFLRSKWSEILNKAKRLYDEQAQTGSTIQFGCTFKRLENVCDNYCV